MNRYSLTCLKYLIILDYIKSERNRLKAKLIVVAQQEKPSKRRPRRRVSPNVRKKQLIESTMWSIAKRGMMDTTLGHVSSHAGLSQGIVNLHFVSKEALFLETLVHLRDEYSQAWKQAVEKAGPTPKDQLAALVAANFSAKLSKLQKLAVWFSFRGQTKGKPIYQEVCEDADQECFDFHIDLIGRIVEEGKYDVDAYDAAMGLTSMIEGIWLNMLMTPEQSDRKQARRICFTYMAGLFPLHFTKEDAEAFR